MSLVAVRLTCANLTLAQDGLVFPRRPRETLFNDLSDADAQAEIRKLAPQPKRGWGEQIKYAGWREIETDYLICAADHMYPFEIQAQLAHVMPCQRVESVDAGHCAPISRPDAVVQFLRRAAGETM